MASDSWRELVGVGIGDAVSGRNEWRERFVLRRRQLSVVLTPLPPILVWKRSGNGLVLWRSAGRVLCRSGLDGVVCEFGRQVWDFCEAKQFLHASEPGNFGVVEEFGGDVLDFAFFEFSPDA